MRTIVRGGTKKEVQSKIDRLLNQKTGWKQLSEIKEDPSTISYNVVEYVAVMENKWSK